MASHSPFSILVTGASTGIYNDISRTLAAQGHPVCTTARKERDLEVLRAIENVTPVQLNVHDLQQVQEAVEVVARVGKLLQNIRGRGRKIVIERGLGIWKSLEVLPRGRLLREALRQAHLVRFRHLLCLLKSCDELPDRGIFFALEKVRTLIARWREDDK